MSARALRVFVPCALAAGVLLAACGKRAPYVYQAHEFDRHLASYGRPITDRNDAIVCYARSTTTPAAIRALAEKACEKVGKRSVFVGTITSPCPLMTPAAAKFACVPR